MKRFSIWMLSILAMVLTMGNLSTVPAVADDTITVESVSYAKDSAAAKATDAVNAKINGATQLLWWYPNHNIKVSMKSVRKAPHIKVRYKACPNQSKSIAKQAKGANIVVAKVGSVICNTGKNGNIIGGFKWKVTKGPAVLKWNSKLKLYQHVYNLIGGKLVKTCGNRMGGKVDQMYGSVVQVRFAGDLEQESLVTADADVAVKIEAYRNCPGGKVYATATASASSSSSAWVRNKLKYMVSAVNAKKVELMAQLSSAVKAQAEAEAKAKITITCGDAPESTPKPNLVETDTINDVLWNNTRTITVTGTVAPGHSASLFASAKNGGSIISGKNQTVTGNFTVQVTYKAPSETPGAGNGVSAGRDQVEFTLTQDDGQSDTIMTNQFQILEPEEHPL